MSRSPAEGQADRNPKPLLRREQAGQPPENSRYPIIRRSTWPLSVISPCPWLPWKRCARRPRRQHAATPRPASPARPEVPRPLTAPSRWEALAGLLGSKVIGPVTCVCS